MILATTALTYDPAWPWSLPGLGLPLLVGTAGLLVVLTIWTYLGQLGMSRRRIGLILVLRLLALAVAVLLVLRPALAYEEDDNIRPSKLLILLDGSVSMNITDEFNNLSRWDNARRILAAPAVAKSLKALGQEARVEINYYQGAEGVKPFDPDGKAEGKRTDMGTWLHDLWQAHGGEKNLRGLVLFTDGADNGAKHPTLQQAAFFRGACPIYPFGLGRTTTTAKQQDIQLVDIQAEPSPVSINTKLTVKGQVHAPGFENSRVTVRLFLEDKEMTVQDAVLRKTQGNEVTLTCDAPANPGEVKVTLKIDPLPGEITPLNNEISTFVSVTKDGVSILWVEGRKRFESIFALRHSLSRDPRFRVYFTEILPGSKPSGENADWFEFDKKHYDVIVIGDISAERFSGGRADVFPKIQKMVTEKGTGLYMMGGYETFANSDWNGPEARALVNLWPVKFTEPGQIIGKVAMQPTKEGLSHYLLRLSDNPAENQKLWKKDFDPLDGNTPLGTVLPGATILATGSQEAPLMVGAQRGKGRVLVFGGDTTYKAWRNSKDTVPAHERFWKQVMLWLSQQENVESNAWVKLDTRSVNAAANQRLGFSAGLRGPGGIDVPNPIITATVVGPGGDKFTVPTIIEGSDIRGYFLRADRPGEYKVEINAEGKDSSGKDVKGTATARFLAYAEDIENLRPAADHDFLMKLSQAGGGRFRLAEERAFLQLLEELQTDSQKQPGRAAEHWPNWSLGPNDPEDLVDQLRALWQSTALIWFMLFVALVCGEWALRRTWGLV